MSNLFPKQFCAMCKDWYYNENDTESILKTRKETEKGVGGYCVYCAKFKGIKLTKSKKKV